jgi:hypothetical protein
MKLRDVIKLLQNEELDKEIDKIIYKTYPNTLKITYDLSKDMYGKKPSSA